MQTLVKAAHLTFTYRGAKQPALQDVSFQIAQGSWTALIGPNGSGKSTITRLLDGLLMPDPGQRQIFIAGQQLTPERVWDLRKQIGIVFQNPDNQFVGATVEDDVAFGLENAQVPRTAMKSRVKQALAEVGMADYAGLAPVHLSGGQKQRVALAGIIALKPRLLILDEATSMLDPEGRRSILKLIQDLQQKTGLTVLSVTHDLSEAQLADQVLLLVNGKLQAAGSPQAVFSQTELLQASGLELPFANKLQLELQKAGVQLPQKIKTSKELVAYLWQLRSTK